MADNLAITAGSGTTIAADDVGGAKYQRVKLSLGADGTVNDATAGAGVNGVDTLRVTIATDDSLPVAVAALSKAEDAAHGSGDKGIMALSVRLDAAASTAGTDGDYAALTTDASGRLRVADVQLATLTLAEDAAAVDGDKGIQALTVRKNTAAATSGTDGDYQPLITDTNGRLHVIEPSCTTLASVVFAEDAASTDADKGIQILTVRKNTAAATSGTDGDYQPLITDTNGRLHTIDVNAALLTQSEDAGHTSGDKGVMALAVRKATAADLSVGATDGDYEPLQVDANGRLHVALSEVTFAEDAASTNGDKGIQLLTVRSNTAAATSGTDGDYQPLITDTNGRLHVKDPDAATLALTVFAEDAASTDADKGVQVLTVRKNTAAATSGTDGDYQPFITDTNGRLHTVQSAVTYAEDAAHTNADPGIFVLSKRTDAPAASSGTDGDYSTINTDAAGRLWVRDPNTVVTVTPTVSASPDYSVGDAVGGIQTIAGASVVSGQPTMLVSVVILDKAKVAPQFDILFFDSNPAAATVTDNAAVVLSTDVTKYIGKVSVVTADWTNVDTMDVASKANIWLDLLPTATSLFAVVVAQGTINLASTADLIFKYGFEQK